MEKEAVGRIQPIKRSNNALVITIIIILILLLVASILGYLIYSYLQGKPPGINGTETDENDTDINVPSQNKTVPPTNETPPSDDDDGGDGWDEGENTCTSTCASLDYECGNWTICGIHRDCGVCGAGKECVEGFCVLSCQDECSSEGLLCQGNMPYNCTKKSDGCFDRTNLTQCGTGQQCVSGQCVLSCQDECSSEGVLCQGNMPYNCTKKSDGCFDRTNLTQCTTGQQCVSGACQIIPSCDDNSDCISLTKTCSVGICNSTGKCEIKYNSTTNLCRASGGDCDIAEYCSGSNADCPANGFRPNTYTCRASGGECDIAELCTGTSTLCPSNGFRPNTYTCRASGGECDIAELCTGNSVACPANVFKPDQTDCSTGVCRLGVCVGCIVDGDCDAVESCQNGVCLSNPCYGAS